ncbi:MAG TPA: hypothetical protein VJ914_27535 [Pseudonocardiaceae bacterium]|nr:hypothetical protein [Pseudonocardiaceae bacterium]
MRIINGFTAAALVAAAIAAPVVLATSSTAAAGVHAQVTVAADGSATTNGADTTGTPWD